MNKRTKLFMISVLAVASLLTITSCNKTNASATIKVGYTPLKTAASTRNVVATGKYALYTKPGTVKGAKRVASKSQMKKFASYTRADTDYYELIGRNHAYKGSTYYFRAYGYKVTYTGSVYYRVVTMNGKYRGYVYGGKKVGSFAGGVKKATTTQAAAIPANFKDYVGVIIPGSVWNYPPYTQYKTKRLGKVNWTIPSLAKFKVTKAVKRTREQDTYYYLKSQKSSVPSGWVSSRYVISYSEVESNEGITHN
ncbi:MAG: hypothetical protein ABF629_12535 [Sporolactobacillus sp.]|uniref:Uncharacterized protein n=1 Tax=Sporolactobacillus nakayamae TaxID=269670 RepID=A0A1I2TKV0_9BACL|nr:MULTISPECIES: hypothetical protein [Sporolactobacillus]MCQ2010184.1 hypothetical protein [Sporolactobacillus sp. STSJ-5]SFG65565.1 hypothetical protein SAMN02982927_02356 [Sporolactobacillus nakayamae]